MIKPAFLKPSKRISNVNQLRQMFALVVTSRTPKSKLGFETSAFHVGPLITFSQSGRLWPMTDLPTRKRWSVAWIVAGVVVALLAAVIGLGVLLLSRYQHTEKVDAASAAREF